MADIITITGALGSGKSTVAGLIVEKLGWSRYSTGNAQRQIAEKYHITTLELNKKAETDSSIDDEIDGVFKGLASSDKSLVVDSRMAWHFLPTSFKVKLEIKPEVAAHRVFKDTERIGEAHTSEEETLDNLTKRRASEVERFKNYYHVDIEDHQNFDLIIDTSDISPEEVADKIITEFQKRHA